MSSYCFPYPLRKKKTTHLVQVTNSLETERNAKEKGKDTPTESELQSVDWPLEVSSDSPGIALECRLITLIYKEKPFCTVLDQCTLPAGKCTREVKLGSKQL